MTDPIKLTPEQKAGVSTLATVVTPFVRVYLENTGRPDSLSPEFVKMLGQGLSMALVLAIDKMVDGDLEGVSLTDLDNMDLHLANLISESRDLDPNKPDPEPWVHVFAGHVPPGHDRPQVRISAGLDDHENCECRYEPRVFPKPGDPDPTPPFNGKEMCGQTEPDGPGFQCTWPKDFSHHIHVAANSLGVIMAAWSE